MIIVGTLLKNLLTKYNACTINQKRDNRKVKKYMQIIVSKKDFKKDVEIIEKKGAGHPDTLADGLAETLSLEFSNYSLKRFGVVLHHNFDKVGLLGGSSYVAFGKGYLINPIKVLINGRVSTGFANKKIPVKQLLIKWTKDFFRAHLPLINVDKNLKICLNISTQSSPGKTQEKEAKKSARQKWFAPESLEDLPELKRLMSNDTSLGVGYAPVSILEKIVLKIENELNCGDFKQKNIWVGGDIKIMGLRNKNKICITMCIPQIAKYVKGINEYINNLSKAKKCIDKIMVDHKIKKYELFINTRDNYKLAELYLTATGSSIESGDEGLVGRGNRINKLISPTKPMSMEGSCGKNPIYHIGKIYYIAAFDLANIIFKRLGVENEVYLISQSGRDLLDPWIIAVNVPLGFKLESELRQIIREKIKQIPEISKSILDNKITIY